MGQIEFHNENFQISAVAKYPADVWVSWAMPRFFQKKPESERREMLEKVYELCNPTPVVEEPTEEVTEETEEDAATDKPRRKRKDRGE